MCPDKDPDPANLVIKPTGMAGSVLSLSAPGILTVTLHEAVNLSAKDDFKERHNDCEHRHDSSNAQPIWCHRCNLPYALLIYEKSEASVDSLRGTTQNPVWIGNRQKGKPWNSCQFDVSFAGELAIYLYLRDPDRTTNRSDICLGLARASPFDADQQTDSQWLQVEQASGSLRISFEYETVGNATLEDSDLAPMNGSLGTSSSGFLQQMRKEDTKRAYIEKHVSTAEESLQLEVAVLARADRIKHPFIAPITLTFLSEGILHILTPFVSGGHLFHHVQMERRLDADRCRFYAAEIVCALEYLHKFHKVFGWLKPRNVRLDATGHVVLCGSRPFMPEATDSIHGSTEYPAPELLLSDQAKSRMADWWTLGTFIYEMLTGLPPFYDDDADSISQNILNHHVRFPESMPLSAQDLIAKLLERSPEKRLGALKGASAIKAHPFFDGINWHDVLLRKYTPPFEPRSTCRPLQQWGVKTSRAPVEYAFSWGDTGFNLPAFDPYNRPASPENPQAAAVRVDCDWELIWENADPRQFQFHNRITGAKQEVIPRALDPSISDDNATRTGNDLNIPSSSQKLDALEAALTAGYFSAVKQLLEYGVDLDVELFGKEQKSPLRWAVGCGNLDLVRLFLDHGADANLRSNSNHRDSVLMTAVKKGNRDIAEALVLRTGRIASTRALGRAVDRRDIAMTKLLLENRVRCDFEDGDRPLPQDPLDNTCYFTDISQPEEFRPPLLRAVQVKDVDLVKLLLLHGANANVAYHDTFQCCRAFELAMKLDNIEMVRLLLENGADVGLPHPVWTVPGHECDPFPRPIYQKVTAGLRAAAATRRTASMDITR